MDSQKKCAGCANFISFKRIRRKALFCSSECHAKHMRKKWRSVNPRVDISAGSIGAIAELIISADLLQKQYEVFRAVSPNCSCDLAILKNGKLLRIEVRTAMRKPNGVFITPKAWIDLLAIKYDILALRTKDGEIRYIPDLATFEPLQV